MAELARIDAVPNGPRIGVYARDLASGESVSFQAGLSAVSLRCAAGMPLPSLTQASLLYLNACNLVIPFA